MNANVAVHEQADRTPVSLVGHPFPGGSVTVEGWENWLFCDAVLADVSLYRDQSRLRQRGYERPIVHPVLVFVAALRGAGITQGEILELCEFEASRGPLFGEQSLNFNEPVFEDLPYDAAGRITRVEHKSGRRLGLFDAVTFECTLARGGQIVATSTSSLILPRRSEQ